MHVLYLVARWETSRLWLQVRSLESEWGQGGAVEATGEVELLCSAYCITILGAWCPSCALSRQRRPDPKTVPKQAGSRQKPCFSLELSSYGHFCVATRDKVLPTVRGAFFYPLFHPKHLTKNSAPLEVHPRTFRTAAASNLRLRRFGGLLCTRWPQSYQHSTTSFLPCFFGSCAPAASPWAGGRHRHSHTRYWVSCCTRHGRPRGTQGGGSRSGGGQPFLAGVSHHGGFTTVLLHVAHRPGACRRLGGADTSSSTRCRDRDRRGRWSLVTRPNALAGGFRQFLHLGVPCPVAGMLTVACRRALRRGEGGVGAHRCGALLGTPRRW